jgi:hypothetical protein
MSEQYTGKLIDSMKHVNSLSINSNKDELEIFYHLSAIAKLESWKNESFYEGAEHLMHMKENKFGSFIREVYGKTTMWFTRMGDILNLENGKTLFLRHGRANMIAYLGFNEEERKAVLELSKERPISTFHNLLTFSGLREKRDAPNEIETIWKSKFEKLNSEYSTLRNEHLSLQRRYDSLKNINSELENELNSLKQSLKAA